MLRSFFSREEGQGLVEYALILTLIVIVSIGVITVLGNQVSENLYEDIVSGLDEAGG
jgi:pilus assembly protein Flp/PilA